MELQIEFFMEQIYAPMKNISHFIHIYPLAINASSTFRLLII